MGVEGGWTETGDGEGDTSGFAGATGVGGGPHPTRKRMNKRADRCVGDRKFMESMNFCGLLACRADSPTFSVPAIRCAVPQRLSAWAGLWLQVR